MHAATLGALAEPSRLRIVEVLRRGPASVGELVDALAIRQPQVSKHLKVLSEAGVVSGTAHGRRRIYRLETEPFEEIGEWAESVRRGWETRLDALGDVLDRMDRS